MISFSEIAAGSRASMSGLATYLLSEALQPDHADITGYFAKEAVNREEQAQAHFDAWALGEVAPYLPTLAEYAVELETISLSDVEARLVRDLDDAIAYKQGGSVSAEARALHGLPPQKMPAAYLLPLSIEDLQARRDTIEEQWMEAAMRAEYQADMRASSEYTGQPAGIVRPDLHPIVSLGLGINPIGNLTSDELSALLGGLRADGDLIEGKHYAKERRLPVNPKTGEQKWSTPIGSYNFVPSPDKTVSVAWAFASPAHREQIYQAHIQASREAIAYIGDEIGHARIGRGGREGFEAGHIMWVEFTHHTARPTVITANSQEVTLEPDKEALGDPHLHTHFVIPNAVFCDSGRVGSLDTMAIRGFIFEADLYYHARLGTLLRESGFAVECDDRTGAARMPIIPENIRVLFSKGAKQGEALARATAISRGEAWDDIPDVEREVRINNEIANSRRKKIEDSDGRPNFSEWARQAKQAGWEPPPSLQFIGPPPPPLTLVERFRKAYEVGLPWLAGRLEHKAVVPHWDLRMAALRGLVHTGTEGLSDIRGVTTLMREEGVCQYGGKTPLIWGQEADKRYTSITTGLHESDEKEFVRLAQAAAYDKTGAIPVGLLKQKLDASGLDFSEAHGKAQRAAIERLGTGGRFGLMLAAAGAGKSASLKPMVAAWKEQWRDCWGASLAWRQADDLVDAGIDPRNVKAFSVLISGLQDGSIKMTDQSVVCVDEFAMLGTRQGLELLRFRERLGFSIVALGDEKQCSAIEAGQLVDLTRRALGAENVPEIQTTIRQQSDRERTIVGLMREGRAAEALAMKRADGTAEMAFGGRDGVIKRVADLYAERLAATGVAPTISAPTNSDAHQISEAVRVQRRKLDYLGPDLYTIKATDGERDYSLRLAKGDRVRLFRSTGAKFLSGGGGSIGRNGSVLEVEHASAAGLTLKTAAGRVGTVAWGSLPEKDGRVQLAYGDATTIHTAQGSTATEHIFALPSGSQAVTGGQAYTANTRHRHVAYLVTSEAAERVAVRESRPINDSHDITLDDKWANVAKAMSYQATQETALAMLDRVLSLKRGSVKAFHHAVQPADPRHPHGPVHAPEIVQRRRVDIGMALSRGVAIVREVYRTVGNGLSWSR